MKLSMFFYRCLIFMAIFSPGVSSFLLDGRLVYSISLLLFVVSSIYLLLVIFNKSGRLKKELATSNGFLMLGFAKGFIVVFVFLNFYAVLYTLMHSEKYVVSALAPSFISFLMLILAVFLAKTIKKPKGSTLLYSDFFFILSLYLTVNLLMWVFGLKGRAGNMAAEDVASFLGMIGLNIQRAYFPLALGVNAFSVVAGATLAYGLSFLHGNLKLNRKIEHHFTFLYVFVPLICLLLADSRGSIFFGFAVVFVPFLRGTLGFFIAILMSVLMFSLVIIGGDFDVAGLSRGSSSTGLLTGRELIWMAALDELYNFKVIHVFGYGAYGQIPSGIADGYAYSFAGWLSDGDEGLMGLHNAYLQMTVDVGYAGFVLFIFAYVSTCMILRQMYLRSELSVLNYQSALAVLAFLLFNGITETTINVENILAFMVLASVFSIPFLRCEKEL